MSDYLHSFYLLGIITFLFNQTIHDVSIVLDRFLIVFDRIVIFVINITTIHIFV